VPPLAVTEFHALDYGIPTSSESMTLRRAAKLFSNRRRAQDKASLLHSGS